MTRILASLVLFVLMCVGRLVAPSAAAFTPTASAPAAPRPPDLDRAVADLADARWAVRRSAAFTLIDAGEASLPALRRAYHESRNHEVQLRIRELAEAIFSAGHTPQKGAFLGIRQRTRLRQTDSRVPAGASWVEVLQVFRDTAADRGELRAGDLIISCDGKSFPEDVSGQVFGGIVSRHRPGAEVSLQVLRGSNKPTTLNVRLGCRPMAVLAEADPETYAVVRSAFEEWWQDRFLPPSSGAAEDSQATTRPKGKTPRPQ